MGMVNVSSGGGGGSNRKKSGGLDGFSGGSGGSGMMGRRDKKSILIAILENSELYDLFMKHLSKVELHTLSTTCTS